MILELLVGAGLVAVGAAAARVVARRQEAGAQSRAQDGGDADNTVETAPDEAIRDAKRAREGQRKRRRERAESGPRGLRVGDVLLYADAEFWLAGCIELDEEGFVARVFVSPGGGRAEFVLQLDPDATDLVPAQRCDEVPDGPVPEALPIGGRRLRLEARGNARITTRGEHLPRTSGRADYTILAGVGGRLLLVVDFESAPRLALVGDRVGRHMVDLLPGGDLKDD